MSNVMIDIETAGTTANAAIASIGAVLFDPHSDWIGDAFHMHVSLESCVNQWQMKIDPATFIWWLGQSEAARQSFANGQQRAASLSESLSAFSRFLPADVTPWCNGASFDFAILAELFDLLERKRTGHLERPGRVTPKGAEVGPAAKFFPDVAGEAANVRPCAAIDLHREPARGHDAKSEPMDDDGAGFERGRFALACQVVGAAAADLDRAEGRRHLPKIAGELRFERSEARISK